MKHHLAACLLLLACAGSVRGESREPVLLPEANVLPLALSDGYEFRKAIIETFTEEIKNDRSIIPNRMIEFKRDRKLRGAIGRLEEYERFGEYFTFFWHVENPADIRVRLEYRQSKLGDYVQAREIAYSGASGTVKTDFRITGDDFANDGPVTSWRALLIENDRVVALKTSYLWN